MTATEPEIDTADAARAASERGDLAAWIREFLSSPGSDNAALADELAERDLHWVGPVQLAFDRLHRLAGPPDQPTVDRLDDDDEETVEGMVASITDDGWEPAPAVVTYDAELDQFVVEDGNHRIEALRRAGNESWWSVVGFASETDAERLTPR